MSRRPKRPYRSAIRGEHARRTRARIVAAVFDEFQQVRPLSMAKIAARAGVATPTVYRHFPTNAALLAAAVAHMEQMLAFDEAPADLAQFARSIPRWFEHFDRNESLLRARFHMAALEDFRGAMLRRRSRDVARATRGVTARMSKGDALRAAALFRLLQSAHAWELLRVGGLSGREAGEVAAWAVAELAEAMRRAPGPIWPPSTGKDSPRRS